MILMVFIFIGFRAVAQDLIIKMDKTEIKSKVLEIGEEVIKYKKFERLDGPTYSISKKDVFMIIYKDGSKEYMDQPLANTSHKAIENTDNTKSTNVVLDKSNTSNINKNQTINNSPSGYYWRFGVNCSLPLGAFAESYTTGWGLDVELAKQYSESIIGFANLGLISFSGKSFSDGMGGTNTVPSAYFFTLMGGAKYRTGKLDVGGGLGYASSDGGGGVMISPTVTYNFFYSKSSFSGSYNIISQDGGCNYLGFAFRYKF